MEIKITGLGNNGEGVGRHENLTVFVEGALPEEEILAEVTQSKKNYAVAKLIKILSESADRVKPFCPIYEECGGCQLQHLSYAAQLKWKRQQIIDAVKHIGKLDGIEILETIGMENPLRYRNKMQFPVARVKSELKIGCYTRGSHKIVDTDSCMIQRAGMDEVLIALKKTSRRNIKHQLINFVFYRRLAIQNFRLAPKYHIVMVSLNILLNTRNLRQFMTNRIDDIFFIGKIFCSSHKYNHQFAVITDSAHNVPQNSSVIIFVICADIVLFQNFFHCR